MFSLKVLLMSHDLVDEETVELEVNRHQEFLNIGLGLVAFTLALGCIGTPSPEKSAWLCFPVIVGLAFWAVRHFPPTIIALRKLEKETGDSQVSEVRKRLEKKYIGIKALITKNFLYWFGLAFFLGVLGSPEFVDWIKT
jgi:hypothetical protein